MTYFLKLLFLVILSFHWKAISHDIVKVAVHIEPPVVDFVDNEFVGKHIEIARALVTTMGKDIQFVQCPFARCFSMLQKGNVDMLIGLRKTIEREETISFLRSPMYYQHFPLRFYVNTENSIRIDTYDDLKELTVGVLRGGTYFERFDQDKKLIKIEMTTHEQLVNMLRKKRIDTFLEREESVLPWINKENYDVEFSLAKYQYDEAVASYIGISKKSKFSADVDEFSKMLEKLKTSGKHQTLFADIE